MNEFCNYLYIAPLEDVESFHPNEIKLKQDKVWLKVETSDFQLDPTINNTKAGTVYELNKELTVEPVSIEIAMRFIIPRYGVCQFPINSKKKLLLGTREFPAKIHVTRGLQKDKVSISIKTSIPFRYIAVL